ncbi:secondary thiamine-phosphate synthase enzyme YjbQ [Planctomycetaceae bacterium]|jgi:secondary thiamine-phosphate synthase enzyme|nr:secondary thiamine-phosphate synthase enzyme YjbQ [Planctomycetaceae bacterium]MDC0261743.1 secondary thiamine-phosphate synthase enzyme YjbQ [Planctomycetaceae bacterium]MDC0274391.1 secondary thiamine-phosphate synthase enzyme YjbQ [Planctomycetaceae bacterium]MDC0307839.1 secondary thiamine-phosphate synthase enzyme YjbQ [Planctomycetaceae bacterium]MDG2389511.1 secondary thiamine-phosphate synthase enzyme YjbQ [Planctomycetaceae bacterium]
MTWSQTEIRLPAHPRGFHLITHEIESGLSDLEPIDVGLLHVFIKHTSASLTINENASPDVPHDMEMAVNKMVPENWPYIHTLEGPDDMPAHIKSSMFGPAITIPISQGRLNLGTWQGVFLCEHRDHGGSRKLLLTLQGE